MQKTLVNCFSLLVASGRSQECNKLLALIDYELNCVDAFTGINKVLILKYGTKTLHKAFVRIAEETWDEIGAFINCSYFPPVGKTSTICPLLLLSANSVHVGVFRKFLERAQTTGRWNGRVALSS